MDYGPYTFVESTPTCERCGRDYGVQLRGYPAGQHLEYRVGVFSGYRGVGATNALRLTGRVAWYPWAAEAGYFYAGSFQGTKKLLAIGTSADAQKGYRSYGADVFYEQPFNQGRQGLTVQLGWVASTGAPFSPPCPGRTPTSSRPASTSPRAA